MGAGDGPPRPAAVFEAGASARLDDVRPDLSRARADRDGRDWHEHRSRLAWSLRACRRVCVINPGYRDRCMANRIDGERRGTGPTLLRLSVRLSRGAPNDGCPDAGRGRTRGLATVLRHLRSADGGRNGHYMVRYRTNARRRE